MTNRDALLKKYGSSEAVTEHFREMQRKSMLNPSKQKGKYRGPFNKLQEENPERLKELSQKAHKVRYNK